MRKIIFIFCALVILGDFCFYAFSSAKDFHDLYVIDQVLDIFDQQKRAEASWLADEELFTQDARSFDLQQEPLNLEGGAQQSFSLEKPREPIILDVLQLKDMDIVDVLNVISKKSGLNIVAGANVRGRVTIYLKDVDVRDALQIILEANNLAYAEENEIIKVLPAKDYEVRYGYLFGQATQTHIIQLQHVLPSDLAKTLSQIASPQGVVIPDDASKTIIIIDRPDKVFLMQKFIGKADIALVTENFVLSHARAEEIAKKIEEVITPNTGRVHWDENSNRLIITDTREKMMRVRNMIRMFDTRQKVVNIEARIVQIVLTDEFKLGIDWKAILSSYHDVALSSTFDILESADKRGNISFGTIDEENSYFLLEALEAISDIETLSSPRITVVNREEAKIMIGSTTPYITQENVTTAAGPVTTSETVNFIDTGVKLYVTPTIHEDGYITMKIKPEVSSVLGAVETSQKNRIPIVETSQAETTVLVKDGVTVVIGGLIKDEKEERVSKVPFLGDIPFFGALFRREAVKIEKRELVIFLTPRIVTGSVSVDEKQEITLRPQKP